MDRNVQWCLNNQVNHTQYHLLYPLLFHQTTEFGSFQTWFLRNPKKSKFSKNFLHEFESKINSKIRFFLIFEWKFHWQWDFWEIPKTKKCSKNRIWFITFESYFRNFWEFHSPNQNFIANLMKKELFENFNFEGYIGYII